MLECTPFVDQRWKHEHGIFHGACTPNLDHQSVGASQATHGGAPADAAAVVAGLPDLPAGAKEWIAATLGSFIPATPAVSAAADPAAGNDDATAAAAAAPNKLLPPIVFRQLFDAGSSTFTYVIADVATKQAIVIDPVDNQVGRDAGIIADLGLDLVYALNTHVHADHITGTAALKVLFPGCRSVLGASNKAAGAVADVFLDDGEKLWFGSRHVEARFTPGHTAGCTSYLLDDVSRIFTGDTLFVRGWPV